jgi:uncharacterized repeat protein (TIGR01451 family)
LASEHSWTTEIYRDLDGNGVLDAAEITAGVVGATDSLAADSSAKFIARVFAPNGAANGMRDSLLVSAVSAFNSAVTDSKVYVTTIDRALLVVSKNQDVANPQPGQTITYTLTYSNTGNSPSLNTVFTDVLTTDVTLVGPSITGGGIYNAGNRTITWTIGRVGPGGGGSVSFQVTVNAQVPFGTGLLNSASYTYVDSANGSVKDTTTNTTSATVALLTGISLTVTPPAQTQDAGLPVTYALAITNDGNAPDTVSLAHTSSVPFNWKFYVDIDGNGSIDGADSLVDVSKLGPLGIGGTIRLVALDTIPHTAPDGTRDSTAYTAASLTNAGSNQTVSAITTVRAPVLALAKSVAVVGGGLATPGATLRYTITFTNNGSGAAAQSVVDDSFPANTAYVANSVTLDAVAKTDAADSDEVTVASGALSVTIGNIAAGASGTITFDVIIN